jgi:hypothetical protein
MSKLSEDLSVNKAPKFNGEDTEYFTWEIRFQAYPGVKGFLQAINLDAADLDLPKNPDDPPLVNGFPLAQKLALERNRVAMYTLTLCLCNQGSMGFMLKARTELYPTGLAWMVMKLLRERYAPKDMVSRIEMKRQLTAVRMGPRDNPAIMF